jgi:hypothetical protein
MANIKYRFALEKPDYNSHLIDINSLDKETFSKGTAFYSLDDFSELIAKIKGVKRRKHFAHKNVNPSASFESYLHVLAKIMFKEGFDDKSIPFNISFLRKYYCAKLLEVGIGCDLKKEKYTIDLKEHFDQISIEKKHGIFIPDLTIFNSDKSKKLLVEIKVTHSISEEKLQLEDPIVEFIINDENDAVNLKHIDTNKIKYKLYNFRTSTTVNDCGGSGECHNHFYVFVVYKSKKSILIGPINDDELLKLKMNTEWFNIVYSGQDLISDDEKVKIFKHNVGLARKKIKIKDYKNCYLCNHCEIQRKTCAEGIIIENTNEALDCIKFEYSDTNIEQLLFLTDFNYQQRNSKSRVNTFWSFMNLRAKQKSGVKIISKKVQIDFDDIIQ